MAVVLTTVAFLLSVGQLVKGFRHRQDLGIAMAAGTWHLVLAPLALLTAALWTLGLPLAIFSTAVFVAPPLLYGRFLGSVSPRLPSTTIRQSVITTRSERTTLRAVEVDPHRGADNLRDARARRGAAGGGTVSLSVIAASWPLRSRSPLPTCSTIDAMSWLIESTGGVGHW